MSVTESNPDPAGTATPSTSPSPPSDEAVPAALSIYGQESPIEETPEVLATSHAALENELDKLPDEKKAGWLHAKEMCPELVNEEHRLMFLRCELFHAEVSLSVGFV